MKNYCQNIRNFCIIAHIDHGKSTLADRFLEITQLISERNMKAQYLDSLALEIERGITIKLKTIQLNYLSASNGETYTLNLIDTPGHVDFHHEVRQTIRACEGAILLIDAVQGIQAQTIANAQLAIARGLNIIPVINKIDLPHAQADVVQQQIKQLLPTITRSALLISAKTGLHVDRLLEVIVSEITPPVNESTGLLQALIFDSYYDQYKGVVLLVRVFRGTIRLQEDIKLMNTNMRYRVVEMGVQTDHRAAVNILSSGQVGWLTANIKKFHQVYRGDTITHFHHPAPAPLPGFTRPQQVIFCNLFPVDSRQFLLLKNTIARLSLEDSGIIYQPVNSSALGAGFNCGFLGLLHMEIFQERVQREGKLTLVITAPTVNYRVFLKKKPQTATIINNPIYWPPVTHIHQIEEPWVLLKMLAPITALGAILKFCEQKRMILKKMIVLDGQRRMMHIAAPLAEIIFNFFGVIKSLSQGFATFDYVFLEYLTATIVRLDLRLNGEPVSGLSRLLHSSSAVSTGQKLCLLLKQLLPRQNFVVPIQAVVNNKIIARETLSASRKNVTAGLYGGDITRKKKVLMRQKKGKQRLRQFGKVRVSHKIYLQVLKYN